MVESIKNTFSGWIAGMITPERLFFLFTILLGSTLSTAYHLNRASNSIHANTEINMEQDTTLALMDSVQRQYALDINTLTVNQKNIEKGLTEIKKMIRDIPR